jgi:RNA recognition motif-containing protein
VTFKDQESAESAVESMNGYIFEGSPLTAISLSEHDPTPPPRPRDGKNKDAC